MSSILWLINITFLFVLILFLLNFMVSEKIFFLKSKQMSFECGIENMKSSRISFSIQFFMICIIFILFDVEVIILLNMIFKFFLFKDYFIFILFILLFVYLTFLMEWKMKSLDWKF